VGRQPGEAVKTINELFSEAEKEIEFYSEGCETKSGLTLKTQDLLSQAYYRGMLDQQDMSTSKTVFVVTFGDGRPGSTIERVVGVYKTHSAAMDAGEQANREAGIPEEKWGDSYGAMIDEVFIDQRCDK
jgi:hypothetical protein